MKFFDAILGFIIVIFIFIEIITARVPTKVKCISIQTIIDTASVYLPKINESVHSINSGGCGYFALTMYRMLDSIGIRVKIVANDNNFDSTRDAIDRRLDDSSSNNTISAFDHVFLKIPSDQIGFDSRGFHNTYYLIRSNFNGYWIIPNKLGYNGYLTEPELEYLVYHGGWNSTFKWADTTKIRDKINLLGMKFKKMIENE